MVVDGELQVDLRAGVELVEVLVEEGFGGGVLVGRTQEAGAEQDGRGRERLGIASAVARTAAEASTAPGVSSIF